MITGILGTLLVVLFLIAAQGLYRNWGQKTFDAMPSHLDEPSEWIGKDHDKVWYTRWVKYVKGWFAVGPRSRFAWARWKFPPEVLFKVGGKGPWRYEAVQNAPESNVYTFILSRCQYYKRWHLVLLWPLQVQFHVYWRAADVPVEGTKWVNEFSICKLLFMYGPIHWDADIMYWMFSFYLGGQWK